ncbi:DBF4-type zinc finger-containing protein 2 [Erythrolamprus reginae]|uniref:DBF4-type zinc finger-containing protein 2 n=1 Tax=Erythrolamprus reginae TaxID=121349 RepID=UPI00396C4926
MEMFDHNKEADEANASSAHNKEADEATTSSAQGMQGKVNEGSFLQDSNSSLNKQGLELSKTGLPVMQNRQGYCNCCHAPYSNLEQHVYSSQHRHFVSYCRNRMGTSSLMERFLQDVLQHHPYRYDDNRPTYDDMPFNSQLLAKDGAAVSVEVKEKERETSRVENPNTESGFPAESDCLISQGYEKQEEASVELLPIQTLGRGQQPKLRASQQNMDISSNINNPTNLLTEKSSQKISFTAKDVLLHPLPVSQVPSAPQRLAKNISYPVKADDIREQATQDICNQDGFLNSNRNFALQPVLSKTVSRLHESPVYNKGNSLISGQCFLKQDDLETQDATQINVCLRNAREPVGTSNSLNFQAVSQSPRQKEHLCRSAENSINEIIEQVVLKYCYEPPPKELPCREEDTNSCVNILSLLDHSSLHGSDMSFDFDPAVDSQANLSKLAAKNLELLKEAKVNLQDENYGTQLSSIFKNVSVQQIEAENDISIQNEEPVLPALPHVPPSFVGKTWSQIMYEDDMKIDELVRDFREGRFRCHFDTEALAHRIPRKKAQKIDKRINAVAPNKTEAGPTKGLPEFTDGLSDGPDFSNLSATSEIHVPKPLRNPQKRIFRLASRCQVVKVSHGTQTSLIHYPVVKQKIIRKDCQVQNQTANLLWSENEKTPTMKTRLCALKLPESYTKIMTPLQPQTLVYVLSCPEMKQFRNKAEEIPKVKSHNSTDSKDSVRYKYKQTSIKYYDPLTNRILKTPPKCIAGGKTKKPVHVRQLFRNLNFDGNRKKQADIQHVSKPCNSPDNHTAPRLLDPVKENGMNSNHHKSEDPSISSEKSECLVCNCSEKCCKHLFISPLKSHQSQQEGDFQFNPFKREGVKCPLKPHTADCLERDNPKKTWQRKKINSRESGFPKKPSELILIKHDLVKKGSRKQPPRSTTQQIEGKIKKNSCTLKSPVLRHHSKNTTIKKYLQKKKGDIKKLTVSRK